MRRSRPGRCAARRARPGRASRALSVAGGGCCARASHRSRRALVDQAGELLDVEQLVAHAGVEALDAGVLPRRARLDVRGSRPAVLAPVPSACAVKSGPLSHRRYSAAPRSATSRSSTSTVRSASMLRLTSIASASRVNSSTMFRSLSTLPSAVWSNRKSNGHTWLGRSARRRCAPTVESPSRRRLRSRCGAPAALPRATAAAPLAVLPAQLGAGDDAHVATPTKNGSPVGLGVTRAVEARESPAPASFRAPQQPLGSCAPPATRRGGRCAQVAEPRAARQAAASVAGAPGNPRACRGFGRLTRASAPLSGDDRRPRAGTACTASGSEGIRFTPR
jgi:hypothetical protein